MTKLVLFLLFLIIALATAFDAGLRTTTLLDVHKTELANLNAGIQTCNANLDTLVANQVTPQQTKCTAISAAIDAVKLNIAQLQKDYDDEVAKRSQVVTRVNTEKSLAQQELNIVLALRAQLNTLADGKFNEEKLEMDPALSQMEAKIQASMRASDALLTAQDVVIATALSKLNEAKNQLPPKQIELSDCQNLVNQAQNAINNQKTQCKTLLDGYNARVAQIDQELQLIKEMWTPVTVPPGAPFAMGQYVNQGVIRSFDANDYTFNSGAGDYILFQSLDATITITARINSQGYITAVSMQYLSMNFAIQEDGSITMNGEPTALPIVVPGVEVFSRPMFQYGNDATLVANAWEMDLTSDFRARIVDINGVKSVYVLIPRQAFFKATYGLFGFFDDKKSNDYLLSNRELITASTMTPANLKKFIDSWKSGNLFVNDVPAAKTLSPTSKTILALQSDSEQVRAVYSRYTSNNQAACSATGDPHYTSVDRTYFNMYRVGDFLLFSNMAQNFVVHQRTHMQRMWRGASTTAALAVLLNSDVVELTGRQGSNIIDVKVNGKSVTISSAGMKLRGGGSITKKSENRYYLTHPSGGQVDFTHSCYSGDSCLGNAYVYGSRQFIYDKSYGLCGSYDNNGSNDLFWNGVNYINNQHAFGDVLQLTARDSLFQIAYDPPNDEILPSEPQWKSPAEKAAAEKACRANGVTDTALAFCMFDIWVFGDIRMAQAAGEAKRIEHDDVQRFLEFKPVMYYPFDEMDNAADVIADKSGNKLDGRLSGSARVNKGYLDLKPSGLFTVKNVPNSYGAGKELTVTFWTSMENVPASNPNSAAGQVLSFGNSWSLQCTRSPTLTSNNYLLTFFPGGSGNLNSNIPINKWVHVAIVYTAGQSADMYVNGIRTALTVDPAQMNIVVPDATSSGRFVIGGKDISTMIKEVRVYNQALDEVQIRGIYNIGDDEFSRALSLLLGTKKSIEKLKSDAIATILNMQSSCNTELNAIIESLAQARSNLTNFVNLIPILQAQEQEALANRTLASQLNGTAYTAYTSRLAECDTLGKIGATKEGLISEIQLISLIRTKFKELSLHGGQQTAEALTLLNDLQARLEEQLAAANAALAAFAEKCTDHAFAVLAKVWQDASAALIKARLIEQQLADALLAQNKIVTAQENLINSMDTQKVAQQTKCLTYAPQITQVTGDYDAQIRSIQLRIDEILAIRAARK